MEILMITICILSLLVLFFGAAAAGVLIGTTIRQTRRESHGAVAAEPPATDSVEANGAKYSRSEDLENAFRNAGLTEGQKAVLRRKLALYQLGSDYLG